MEDVCDIGERITCVSLKIASSQYIAIALKWDCRGKLNCNLNCAFYRATVFWWQQIENEALKI